MATTALSQETSIDVTWTAGTDSSPAATGTNTFYVACVASVGATCPTGVTFNDGRPAGQTTTTVGGLTPGTSYVCYVVAKNWNGAEVCSLASSAVTTAAATSAAAPTISSVVSILDGQSAVVTWSPGAVSAPAATDPSFYVACVASAGATCPTGLTFDVARPAGQTTTTVGGLTPGTSYTCYVVAKNWNGEEVCSSGVDLNPFYLDTNSVTVKCPGVAVGASFTLGGVTYTKRDRAGLDALVSSANEADLVTSCTTGVTDLSELFGEALGGSKVSDPATFNPDLSSWDVSSVTDMNGMFYVRAPPSRVLLLLRRRGVVATRAASARSEGRLLTFGSVHPWARRVPERLEQQRAAGARGIKVHPNAQAIAPDHPRAMRLYHHCGELGLPVLWHCGPVGIEPALGRYL
ncbi:MAG: amidohydrolase family protein, partial [Actinomycetia bacterium]|nr:amidohydrolase family protein [Actinomycetes bacterium]